MGETRSHKAYWLRRYVVFSDATFSLHIISCKARFASRTITVKLSSFAESNSAWQAVIFWHGLDTIIHKPDEWHTIYYEAQHCLYGKRDLSMGWNPLGQRPTKSVQGNRTWCSISIHLHMYDNVPVRWGVVNTIRTMICIIIRICVEYI